MENILRGKETVWNERLGLCMDKKKITQEKLAEEMNLKYDTKFTQRSVSRWLRIGTVTKEGKIVFPRIETMLLIADFFQVDLGYLLGETEEESFSIEKASAYTGLDAKAIKAIRTYTAHEGKKNSWMRLDMGEALNSFLTAEEFRDFYMCLYELHMWSHILERNKERVYYDKDEVGKEEMNLEYEGKILRYELSEKLFRLVEEVYPKPCLKGANVLIDRDNEDCE